MQTHDIYIYGEIGTGWQDENLPAWGVVTLRDVKDQLAEGKDADEFHVHINSKGGGVDEGFAIHDLLKTSGKKIVTYVEGMCASIATIIFLAGEERHITENSTGLIHFPMAGVMGTAEEIEDAAEELQKIEDKIIDAYVTVTGSTKAVLKPLMEDEQRLDADKMLELGFATDVIKTLQAVALFSTGKRDKIIDTIIKKQTAMSKTFDKVEGVLDKILTAMNIKGEIIEPKDTLVLTTEDGITLTVLTGESKAEVGNEVRVDNKVPEDGNFVMANRETYHVKDGKIETIDEAPKDTVEEPNKELDKLRADNDALAAKITTLEASNKTMQDAHENELDKITVTLDKIQEGMGSDYKPPQAAFQEKQADGESPVAGVGHTKSY